jgi:hypothetical protein
MTEEDAKQKWCPFTRAMAASVGTSANRLLNGAPHRGSMCIASACMAWRWNVPTYSGRYGETPTGQDPIEGHCGLAGRP